MQVTPPGVVAHDPGVCSTRGGAWVRETKFVFSLKFFLRALCAFAPPRETLLKLY